MWQDIPNWAAQTSFTEQVTPPTADPGDDPLVCPAINTEWIPYVCGALMQLVQPAIWRTASSDALNLVLAQATDLIAAVGGAVGCMAFSLQFTEGCTLQYSTDGGMTWTDVTGWDAYFAACTQGTAGGGGGAPVPVIPGLTGTELGCNIAGYLVQTLLRQFVAKALQTVLASGVVADLIDGIVAIIPGVDAITPLVILASSTLVGVIADNTASEWGATVLTDLVWSKLGCLIANAIGDFTGWTQDVVNAITTAITGSALAPTIVLDSLANFIDNLGIPGLASATAPGAITTYDCSQCGMGGTGVLAGPGPLMITPQLQLTDGTTTVLGVNDIVVDGATVSGTTGTATITISGGGGSLPVPIFPSGQTTAEQACNIVGYLVNEIIVQALLVCFAELGPPPSGLWVAALLAQAYPGSGPVIAEITDAVAILYAAMATGWAGQANTAAQDTAYLASLTCVIQTAIESSGYVTAANFAALVSAVNDLTCPDGDDVPAGIAAFLTNLTDLGVAQLTLPGAWASYDCTACGSTGATGPAQPVSPVTFDLATTDGTTTVSPTETLTLAGATVTDEGGGIALITIPTPGVVFLAEVAIGGTHEPIMAFTAPSSGYRHLRFVGEIKGSGGDDDDEALLWELQFNEDASALYYFTLTAAFGTTTAVVSTASAGTAILLPNAPNGSNFSHPVRFTIDVPYYQDTTFTKSLIGFFNGFYEEFPSLARLDGFWQSTAAITSIQFLLQPGYTFEFGTGSKISMYGIV